MARTFTTIPAEVMKVPPRTWPASLLNPPTVRPQAILAAIDWSLYGAGTNKPNVNVLFNVGVGGPQLAIDQIRSVKIDNLGNPVPVYVYFADTTDCIVAPPNTIVWEPVVTQGKVANIVGEGFSNGQVGATNVYFCNFFMPPYVDREIDQAVALWKASASITRQQSILNQNFGVPALGDQVVGNFISLTATGATVAIPTALSGFNYITGIYIYGLSLKSAAGGVTLDLETITGTLITRWLFAPPADATKTFENLPVASWPSLNWKFDATLGIQWRVQSVIDQGGVVCKLSYTTNPQ